MFSSGRKHVALAGVQEAARLRGDPSGDAVDPVGLQFQIEFVVDFVQAGAAVDQPAVGVERLDLRGFLLRAQENFAGDGFDDVAARDVGHV